jgi:isopenicillin-N epimerase
MGYGTRCPAGAFERHDHRCPAGSGPATPEAAKEIYRRLRHEFDVEVLVVPFAGRLWARISAYLYNEISDYARLADAVDRLTK